MNDSLGDYLHFISDTPSNIQDSDPKENVIAMLKKKKECEVRAMKILEFLIEGKIISQVFLRCINFLNYAYYDDIVEERSITNLCGYCLCGNDIPKQSKKKFAIDSKNKKVYDVTDRKKFCSDYCYKASLHIKKQINDNPLWLRTFEDLPNYTLLPLTDKGLPGDDLTTNENTIKKEESQFDSAFSFAEVSLQEIKQMNEQESIMRNETPQNSNIFIKERVQQSSSLENSNNSGMNNEMKVPSQSVESKSKISTKVKKQNKLKILKKYILEWLTLDTYIFLFGIERIREHASKLDLTLPSTSTVQQRGLSELCNKLALTEYADNKHDRMLFQQDLKPLPSYKQLKKDNKSVNIKVRSFYSGDTYEVNDTKEESKKNFDTTLDNSSDMLPIVQSPNLIRQGVFITNIRSAIKTLTVPLDLPWENVLTKIESLVKTFSFQPYSVIFQPAEWSLIALILIKMLSFHDSSIKKQLDSKRCRDFIDATIFSLPGVQVMLNGLCDNINDIDGFIKGFLNVENGSNV